MFARFRYVALAVFFILTITTPIAHASGTAISNTTITFDSVGETEHSGSTLALSWSHTTNPGSNLILIAGVLLGDSGTVPTVASFTYGATALTKIVSLISASGHIDGELWELLNPGAGTGTITVTFSGSASLGAFGGSGTFFGVSGVRGFASAQALTVSIASPKTAVGDLLIDGVGAVTSDLTPDASQTLLAKTLSPLNGLSAALGGKGAGSFQMSWTGGITGVSDPVMGVVSLIPAAGAVVPEYPWGLPLLTILMVLSYGVVKRRVQTKQEP